MYRYHAITFLITMTIAIVISGWLGSFLPMSSPSIIVRLITAMAAFSLGINIGRIALYIYHRWLE